MTDYKATPEQWQSLDNNACIFAYEACILELRARVEALEASAAKGSDHIGEKNKMVNSSAGLTSSLVERVALAIDTCKDFSAWDDDGKTLNWAPEARAAIREVIDWLREQEFDYLVIRCLEQEVDQ